ncbi:MAG: hypothetical protein ACTHML_08685 [Ginsengibacter sp.]
MILESTILEKEKFIDQLFWFTIFTNRHYSYRILQKKKLSEHGKESAEWFASFQEEFSEMTELGGAVIEDILKQKEAHPKKDFEIILAIIQSYLNTLYDQERTDIANESWLPLHPVISKIQETIRQVINTKNEKAKMLTFESWFFDKKDVQFCLSALQNAKPVIINEKYEYLLGKRNKSAITAWVSILHKFNYVRHPGNELTAPIINDKIKNLNVSGKTLRTPNGKAYTQYIKDFQFLIPRKK